MRATDGSVASVGSSRWFVRHPSCARVFPLTAFQTRLRLMNISSPTFRRCQPISSACSVLRSKPALQSTTTAPSVRSSRNRQQLDMDRSLIRWGPLRSFLVAVVAVSLSASTTRPGGAGAAAAVVPDLPASFTGSWSVPSGHGSSTSGSKAPSERSYRRLEEQASQETRETFGEDFCRQLEDEQEAVRAVHRRKASVGAKAGCHPSSPLASSSPDGLSLSSLGVFGSPEDGDGDGGKSRDGVEDPMADWLR